MAEVWDTSTPLGSDPVSQGDDRIREMKAAIQAALRGQTTEGLEAIFPGSAPTTAPVYRYRGLKGTTGARPASGQYGLYYNTTLNILQRDNGSSWDNIGVNPETEAIHEVVAGALASSSGVVTLDETTNSFDVTGTEAITQIAGWSAGIVRIKWASARIITYHATNLILQGAVSRNVIAGDIQTFQFTGSNTVREIGYESAAGGGQRAGKIEEWGGATCPAGFLECDGTSYLRADYPALYAAIGTVHGTADGTHFNVPDHRGRFARGYDHGASRDPDKATRTAAATGGATGDNVGSVQDDAFESHLHSQNGALNTVNADGASGGFANAFGGNTGSTGGNETRPMNAYVMKIIRI